MRAVVNARCAWEGALFLILSSATLTAAPLARSEGAYVELMTLSIGVTNMCEGYDVDDTNVLKFVEMNSVKIRKLGPATLNAMEAVVGGEFDVSSLIPDVTRVVNAVATQMTRDVEVMGRTRACDRYGKRLIAARFLRRLAAPRAG
jgi:hypothetical protein